MQTRSIFLFLLLWMLSACVLESGQDDDDIDGFHYPVEGSAARLSNEAFFALPAEKQYSVANKLYGTLYKGIAAKDYFDFERGTASLQRKTGVNPLSELRSALNRPYTAEDYSAVLTKIEEKYFTDRNGRERWDPKEVPLTYLYELDLSYDYFNYWIAYQLVNNILFSPAQELDSVDLTDVQSVYTRLVYWIGENKSVRDIIYEHMISEENWRRFRSPEDNTREMMEIYLLRFIDDEVPRAARACQNWGLSDDTQNYQLIKTTDFNSRAQSLLDTNDIVTCEDFFRTVARHPGLMPAVVTRIVEQLLADAPQNQKNALINGILSANPKTFRQIYAVLINSRAFLLNAPKTKSVEEAFFNLAGRLYWQPSSGFFSTLTSDYMGNNAETLRKMQQNAMTYKLGRPNLVPVDSLSFAYYHGLVRNDLLLYEKNPNNINSQGWRSSIYDDGELADLSNAEFIDYAFIAVLGRKAKNQESAELQVVFDEVNAASNRKKQTRIIFDYLSRLAELYAYQS